MTLHLMENASSLVGVQEVEVPASPYEMEGADEPGEVQPARAELELLLEAAAQQAVARQVPCEEACWPLVVELLQHPVLDFGATMPCTLHSSCS